MNKEVKEELDKILKKYSCDNINEINWYNFNFNHHKISEDFIREFKDSVDWIYICTYQKLSEKFMSEFKDKLDWKSVGPYQRMSKDFIEKFKDKLDLEYLLKYNQIDQKFYNKLKNIKLLSRFQLLDFS